MPKHLEVTFGDFASYSNFPRPRVPGSTSPDSSKWSRAGPSPPVYRRRASSMTPALKRIRPDLGRPGKIIAVPFSLTAYSAGSTKIHAVPKAHDPPSVQTRTDTS